MSHGERTAQARSLTGPGGRPIRALVVDDEDTLAELVSMALRYEGWQVERAGDGLAALKAAAEFRPDIVVLDVMMPVMDGLAALPRLRAAQPEVPIMFLTAKDATEDRIAGLTVGGDDYLTKPFSIEELVLRLKNLLRRSSAIEAEDSASLVVGDLVLNDDSREVTRAGEPVTLTVTEFDLLRYLMVNARRVVSKAQILDRVWHYDFSGNANIVELYISYLRKKVDVGRGPMIHTIRGVGYVLKPT